MSISDVIKYAAIVAIILLINELLTMFV